MMKIRNVMLSVVVVITALAGLGVAASPAAAASWEQMGAGESRWTSFEYNGDGSQVVVRLEATQAGSLSFEVYTPDEMRRLEDGDRAQPIGRGSAEGKAEGTLIWSGNFTTAGTYAVKVERAGNTAGTVAYLLTISGSGVLSTSETPAATTGTTTTPKTTTTQSALAKGLSGKLLIQASYGGAFYTINVDGTGLKRIGSGIDPTWSPDGTQIAYVSWQDPRGVWVANSDGTGARRVFDWNETRYPSWSADGSEIIFSRAKSSSSSGSGGGKGKGPGGGPGGPPGGGSSSSSWTLGVISADGSAFWEPQPVSDTNLTPDWSPDGQAVVLTGYRGLMVQSADGKTSYQLTTDPRDTSPTWSPDGTKVAYAHRQHDHWEIYVVEAATGRQTKVTTTPAGPQSPLGAGPAASPASSVSPAWSPDGKSIAFLTNRSGTWQVWVMAADGSQAGPLFDTALNGLAPDGARGLAPDGARGLALSYAFSGERALDWVR
jgi:hypothetical protein